MLHITPIVLELLIFVCISIPIYILFLLTLIINRKKEPFNSHFFYLCISLGVADLGAVIHSYLFLRLPEWGWQWSWFVENGYKGSFLAFYAMSLQFALGVAQHLGVVLIGANRLSRMCFSRNTYDRVWTRKSFWAAVFIQWFLPAIICASMAFQNFQYTKFVYLYAVDPESANVDFSDSEVETIYFGIAVVVNGTVNVFTCAMYITVFVVSLKNSLKQRGYKVKWAKPSNENDVNEELKEKQQSRVIRQAEILSFQREAKLAVTGFALFLVMLLYFAILLYIVITEDFTYTFWWYAASDLFSCINPYTLLLMSTETRKQFFRLLRCHFT